MEWQDWLEKTEPTGLTARQKKLAKEIADGDKDDHTQYYTKNDVNKILGAIAGAVGGASKVVGEAAGKIGGSVGRAVGDVASNPVVQEGVGNAVSAGTDKVDNLVEDVKNENQTGVSKAWETWLEKNDPCWEGYEQYGMKDKEGKKVPNCVKKNNATETSHKEGEKKEEWNGKFDNSTTRDDAENDDDKAIGEEESLEELTDGKLEEVEKLKAWEVFLEKNQYPQDNIPEKKDEDGDSEINYETGTKLQESKETGQATLTDDKHRDMENEDTSNNLTQRFRRGNLKGQKQGAGRKGYNNAGASGGVPKGWAGKYGKGGKSFGADQWGGTMSGDSARPNADGTRTTLDGLRQQIQRINEHENKKELSSTGQPATAQQKEVADIESVGKSWELFLEKGITYKEQNVGVHKEQPYAKARTAKEIREAAENVKTEIVLDEDMKKKKSWNEWLEKMQGAGDARFGNQHLTGMEQKPVADDESIELSAESEENNEKQEKTEDKEDKDNKPYKALSQE